MQYSQIPSGLRGNLPSRADLSTMVRIQKKAKDVDLSVRKNVKGAGAFYSISKKNQLGDILPDDIGHLIIKHVMVGQEKEKQRNKEKLITGHKALYQETSDTCALFGESILAVIDAGFVPYSVAHMVSSDANSSVSFLEYEYECILEKFRNDRSLLEPGAADKCAAKFRDNCARAVKRLTDLDCIVSKYVR